MKPLQPHFARRLQSAVLCTTYCLLLAACGQSVSGRYDASPRGFFEYMDFRSGGKVEVGKFGSVSELTYEIENDRIKVSRGGQTQILTVDEDGCLEGGKMMGKYCKK